MARNSGNPGPKTSNGNGAPRKPPIPLTLVDNGEDLEEEDDETYIVVGEAGEDVAFEVCEDLEIALGVREAMMEDGFAVKMYQAVEIEIVTDDDAPSPGGQAA